MSYIPIGHIARPVIDNRWVKISEQKNKSTIWVYKNQMKEDKNFHKMFRGTRRWSHEVNLVYVTGSEYEFKKIVKHKGKEVASCIKLENDAPYLVMLSVEVKPKEK